jgi:transposase-like protein
MKPLNIGLSDALKLAYKEGRRSAWPDGNPSQRKDCPDETRLRALYVDEKMGSWAIAREFGVNQNLVRKWLARAGIEARSHRDAALITRNFPAANAAITKAWADKGYNARHKWARDNFTHDGVCEGCGKSGLSGRKIHWSNHDHMYSRQREDWAALCRPCHAKHDMESNGTDFRNGRAINAELRAIP